jgi:hypothetical protein
MRQLLISAFAIIVIDLLAPGACAQPPLPCSGDRCGEWIVQSTSPVVPGAVAAPTGLPECQKHDELDCAEECRREFGTDFHRCRTNCLRGKCSEPPPKKRDDDSRKDGELCIEIESESCETECNTTLSGSTDGAKCRRECLQRKCPNARRYDTAMEGLDPGTTACNRCEAKHQRRCERRCRSATLRIPTNQLPELREFGCEKLCMTSACGAECTVKNPF